MPGVRSGSSVGPGNGQTGSERVNGSLGLSRGAGRVPDRLGGAEEEGSGFCRRLPAHLHRHTHLSGAAFHSLRAAQGRGLQPDTLAPPARGYQPTLLSPNTGHKPLRGSPAPGPSDCPQAGPAALCRRFGKLACLIRAR